MDKECFYSCCREEIDFVCNCASKSTYMCKNHLWMHYIIDGNHSPQLIWYKLNLEEKFSLVEKIQNSLKILSQDSEEIILTSENIIKSVTNTTLLVINRINLMKRQFNKIYEKILQQNSIEKVVISKIESINKETLYTYFNDYSEEDSNTAVIESFSKNCIDFQLKICKFLFNNNIIPANISWLKIGKQKCNKKINEDEIIRKELIEVPLSFVLDYSNLATKEIQDKFGPFIYCEKKNSNTVKRGPVLMENEAIYIGEWNLLNQRHGRGIQYWKNGSIYEGYWNKDKACGKGRKIYAGDIYAGDVYEGDWLDDAFHGKGIYIYNNGGKYDGLWEFNKKHGIGVAVWPDGKKYQGIYRNDLKHGYGRFEWANGTIFEGNFTEDKIEGRGTKIFNKGCEFIGQWKNNKMEGKGIYTWDNGNSYYGEFVESKRWGFGIIIRPDGQKYIGQWYEDKKHGKGINISLNGKIIEEEWKEGNIVG